MTVTRLEFRHIVEDVGIVALHVLDEVVVVHGERRAEDESLRLSGLVVTLVCGSNSKTTCTGTPWAHTFNMSMTRCKRWSMSSLGQVKSSAASYSEQFSSTQGTKFYSMCFVAPSPFSYSGNAAFFAHKM